jgi:hypothetical protein
VVITIAVFVLLRLSRLETSACDCAAVVPRMVCWTFLYLRIVTPQFEAYVGAEEERDKSIPVDKSTSHQ